MESRIFTVCTGFKFTIMNEENQQANAEPLGHGDHWQAMGLEGEPLVEYLQQLAKQVDAPRIFSAPWPDAGYDKVVLMHRPLGYLSLLVLCGLNDHENSLSLLSAFPVFTRTMEWIVRVGNVSSAYGAYEGVVCAHAAAGHGLAFFAPYFGLEAEHWRRSSLARVALVGLALRLEKFDAETIRVTEGPLVENAKSELRAEGRGEEADDPDFHVTVEMDRMRTLYSLNHDHHQIIGRVMSVATARPSPRFQGWRLEIECMPDKAASGCRLPVFVFPPALGPETPPRKGDLVTGTVWLQGSWISGETERDLEIWKESGGE